MSYISFPENIMIIPGLAPTVGTGAEQTSIPISLKLVQKLWAVVYLNTAVGGAAVACVPQTHADVAFGASTVLPATLHAVPIWVNTTAALSDTYTRQTDAVNFTTTGDALCKIVVFEIDPTLIRTTATATSDDDCFRISLTAVNALDYAAIFYVVLPRYPQAVPPSIIVD